jgi:predicted amidohydrolase YtcJ
MQNLQPWAQRPIRKLSGPSTRILDAGGKTIVPGLQDNHLHNAGGGPGVDLFNARMLQEVLDRIRARVQETKPGDVVVTNSDWHEAQLKEQRLPYRKDLDRVAPKTPVVVVRGGHEYILNSAALSKWHIDKSTPQPAGGRISRDENGELNGELVDRAKALVTLPPEPQPGPAYFLEEHKKLNAAGLTGIRYPGASIEQYRALQELEKKGLLTIRVNQLLRPPANDAATMAKMLASYNVKPDEGNEWLRLGGVKLAVDGGFEGGWMTELYTTPYDEGGKYYGINTLKQEPYTAIVKELNRPGLARGHSCGRRRRHRRGSGSLRSSRCRKVHRRTPLDNRARLHSASGPFPSHEAARLDHFGPGSPLCGGTQPREDVGSETRRVDDAFAHLS